MNITRNKFSNAICVIFSVVLVGLFCVYTRSRLGLNNIVSCAIIAAVLCGIVACLIFFANRIINKFSQGKSFNDRLIFNVVLIVVSLIFVIIRLLMISNIIDVPMVLGDNYANAISVDGGIYVNLSTVDGVVSTLLSAFIGLLGNSYFPIILVQLIFNILSYVLILFGIKDLMGRMASLAVCFGLAVGPVFYSSVASDGAENIVLFIFGIIVFITSKYKKSIDEYEVKWLFSLFIGILLGLFGLYHKVFLFIPIIPIVVLWDCSFETTSKKIGNTFSILIGVCIGFLVPIIIDCFAFGNGGVDGFIDSIIIHFAARFRSAIDMSIIERFVTLDCILWVLLFCIAYCVLFWKSEDDAGHILGTYVILLLAQMLLTGVGVSNVYPMITVIGMLAVAGYSFCNIGYDPDASDFYRIDDDMQPAVVQTIGNKVVASDEEIKSIFAENEEKEKANAIASAEEKAKESLMAETETGDSDSVTKENVESNSLDNSVIDNSEIPEIPDNSEIQGYSIKEADMPAIAVETSMDEAGNGLDDRKYSEPEERKSSDFGMKDADFASLFDGSSIPPKFARNDMYSDWDTIAEEEEVQTEERVDESNTEDTTEEIASEVTEEISTEENDEKQDDSKDKKAYVDTFFSYLYDESVFEQPIEIPEPKPVEEEKYVSNASKFADLDLDLGVDAFDYVPDNEGETDDTSDSVVEEVTKAIIPISEEASTEEAPTEEVLTEEVLTEEVLTKEVLTEEVLTEDVLTEEASTEEVLTEEVLTEEASTEEVLTENLLSEDVLTEEVLSEEIPTEGMSADSEPIVFEDTTKEEPVININVEEEFDFDEVLPRRNKDEFNITGWDNIGTDDLEKSLDDYSKSVEDEVFKALSEFDAPKDEEYSVEEAIEKKIREEEGFSYEETITRRLEEEAQKAAAGFSIEEALEKKLDVEQSIMEAGSKLAFSYEDTLNQKIALEESLTNIDSENEFSVEDVLLKKFEVEEALKNSNAENDFSIQEAIEQKIDVEKEINNELNKPLLDVIDEFESIDNTLIEEGESLLFNDGELFEDIHFDTTEESAVEELTFEPVAENNAEELMFEPVAESTSEELIFEPVAESTTEELIFEPIQENTAEELMLEPVVESAAEELIFEPVAESATEDLIFEPVAESTTEELIFEPIAENAAEELVFEPVAESTTEELIFEPVAESTTEELMLEPVAESTTEELIFEPVAENAAEELIFEPVAESTAEELTFKPAVENSTDDVETDSNNEVVAKEEKTVEFIENPLPLPKKHVHRELDYGRSVPENWMHYDVEINNKNNFYDI